ncbi:DEHA2D16412p [Debaryomyces hansenii CBS767]|uniref:DEHA2D16412p n=1 Tax=Debaryomyces hansenii (strain ATCC 36239 / CBS 767 / BCRC 21394 / JCM 1990 / NBRC 0083 / IGC 2968) TaxID=284592 RepID=Q6BRH1_DEBHA|nr:DEHA2D16412p [Debaryomyces hansenii CBS767]CAG87370.2 DEHA2D16412p [Debaryomyces hansenii CBS767]|eukprot:XP_459199.2 DEHA2D16412p [Debaryomyces hansenii CBS767]
MTSSSSQLAKLALKGSSKIVADYFEFAINSILFQRGIYPPEDFHTIKKYGLPLLVSADDDVKAYIEKIMSQVKRWIYGRKIGKLVVVIISKSTAEVVERWEFNIEILQDNENNNEDDKQEVEKPREESHREIQMIIRQITSSVSYLPLLDVDEYTFNVLVHTDPNYDTAHIPHEWCDTDGNAKLIEGNSIEQVKFKSFSTNIHEIGTTVSYKLDET